MRYIVGSALPEGSTLRDRAFHPLRQALQFCGDLARTKQDKWKVNAAALRVLADFDPSLEGIPEVNALPKPASLAVGDAQVRAYAALTSALSSICSPKQPLLLVLDDIQWADELTLGWLA